jgi:lactoylglutathione lyase
MELYIKITGLVSAALTTSSFLPQMIKTWRSRSTGDLSPLMFSLFTLGIVGWLVYGIFIHDLPIILANSVTIVLAGTIMYFIIRGKKDRKLIHVGLYARNIDSLTNFYETWFGAYSGALYNNPAKRFSSRFISIGNGCRIEVMHQQPSSAAGADNATGHLAISVGSKEEVDRITRSMKTAGIRIIDGPRTTGDGFYESVVADPEGNRIEITI